MMLFNFNYSIIDFLFMGYNSVLKNSGEVSEAVERLHSLGLFSHHNRVKSWDTFKMVNLISQADRSSFILDVGCNGSPILPMLRRLGFKNLYGCDLYLKKRSSALMKLVYFFYKREYQPIIEMYEGKKFDISVQDLEKTKFQSNTFDYITSLSVIEHSINIKNYFKEMNRIMKKGGMLLTSTDYWPDKIRNVINTKDNRKNSPDTVFSRQEIEEDVINISKQNGFVLTEPIDFTFEDKVIHWDATGLDYTFIFFALRKKESL
jgi:SAM-dependent methyltransferase